MTKLRRWLYGMANTSPSSYRMLRNTHDCQTCIDTFEVVSAGSVESLYEDIDKCNQDQNGTTYKMYLQTYFTELRDSRIQGQQKGDDMSPIRSNEFRSGCEDTGEYRFEKNDLLKRIQGGVCSRNLPKICICSCEMGCKKTDFGSHFASWDAGWVFHGGERDMRMLMRRSCERIEERLFDEEQVDYGSGLMGKGFLKFTLA